MLRYIHSVNINKCGFIYEGFNMDFAKQQLEKYGWKDGEGLGKNRTGICDPIKAKLKFDNAGLGHNIADEIINPWWQRVYDSAAENLNVSKNDEAICIETTGETEVTTKRKKCKKSKEKYGNFVKLSALTWQGEQRIGDIDNDDDYLDEPIKKKRTSGICDLTDEELFKACGGRTAHKGARHGLSMSAKLARSAQLEEEALLKIKKSIKDAKNEDNTTDVKKKKKKKKKDKK